MTRRRRDLDKIESAKTVPVQNGDKRRHEKMIEMFIMLSRI